MDNIAVRCTSLAYDHRNIGILQHDQAVMYRHFNPYGQKIRPSQFPDQSRPVDSHRGSTQRAQPQRPGYTTQAPCPTPTTVPPPAPPSGPMSISQSAVVMTPRLCSMMTMVLPASRSWCSTLSSSAMSAKCRPVVGSYRMCRAHRQFQNLRDILALVLDLERFSVVALAGAHVAGHIFWVRSLVGRCARSNCRIQRD